MKILRHYGVFSPFGSKKIAANSKKENIFDFVVIIDATAVFLFLPRWDGGGRRGGGVKVEGKLCLPHHFC